MLKQTLLHLFKLDDEVNNIKTNLITLVFVILIVQFSVLIQQSSGVKHLLASCNITKYLTWLHLCLLFSSCSLACWFNKALVWNICLQVAHSNVGFWWYFMCFCSWSLSLNHLSCGHNAHLNFLSSVCTNSCFFKLPFLFNYYDVTNV